MTDPHVLTIISVVFAMLTAYSLYMGVRQVRDARRAGRPQHWYSNLSLLTGIEYGLLTFVFLLRTASVQGVIAPGMQGLADTLYLVLLIPAALIAALVIRRVLLNFRESRQGQRAVSAATPLVQHQEDDTEQVLSKEERELRTRRQRERRKKAAAARRRQAGKA